MQLRAADANRGSEGSGEGGGRSWGDKGAGVCFPFRQ